MSVISVQGLQSLKGEIKIQGSKNAALPMMAAALLHKGTTVIRGVPRIQDVFCMLGILNSLGCICCMEGNTLIIDASELISAEIPESFVKSMRSSIIAAGALLGRCGCAATSYPGGCSIGKRPIDLHLAAFRALGADISEKEERLMVSARKLTGSPIYFPYPSVGATENAVLAAVKAEGITVIYGAAKEPEIIILCQFLNHMGAEISGIGTSLLTIRGVRALRDTQYTVDGDRIVAGTYLAAVMASGGEITMRGVRPEYMTSALDLAEKMGADIRRFDNDLEVTVYGRPEAASLITGPYPRFPTDLQSPMMAVMSVALGPSRIEETVFEGRFGTAKELQKMGADIIIEGNRAMIQGLWPLQGSRVTAGDLRGGAALVVAGLAAEGRTLVEECRHIERGYEDICRDLQLLGGQLEEWNDKT